MKTFSQALAALLVLSLCLVSTQAQQGSGFKFLEVKVVDPDGKPVTDASVDVTMDSVSFPMPTDEKGMISLNVPGGPNSSLRLKVQKDGFASVAGSWGAGEEIPAEIEIKMQPGVEIGGIVQDEQGNPVEGVTVEAQEFGAGFSYSAPGEKGMRSALSGQLGVTDDEGRWRYRGASDDTIAQKVSYYLHLSHPDYANDNNRHEVTFEQLRAADHVLVLQKGIELRGTVTDLEGNPVVGAKIALGGDLGQKNQTKNTDAEGSYLFGNVPSGQTVMTVFSPDFAPELRVVATQKGMAPVDFQLKKGKPMRIHVTDKRGKPIVDVGVIADTWRGYRSLPQMGIAESTDGEGLYLWENAPDDKISYDFFHRDFMSLRRQPLAAGDEQHEIVLQDPILIKGTVVDAATSLPVELFNVVQGMRYGPNNTNVSWERYNLQAGRDGKFELRFSEPREVHLVRIEAKGYKPVVSREIKDGEGKVTLNFKLEHGTGPSGIVKLPDGSPAAGARVVMASAGGQIYVQNGKDEQQDDAISTVADNEGKYQLPFPDSDYSTVFLHEGGWAQVTGSVLENTPDVTLGKWARLEGAVRISNQPRINERVTLNYNEVYDQNGTNTYWYYDARTDNNGNFTIEHLKAGDALVGRIITFGVGTMQMSDFSHGVPIQLRSGETTQVQIGGAGRRISGKIVLPEEYDGPNPWSMGQVQLHEQQTAVTGAGQLFFQLGRAVAQNNAWNPAFVAQELPPTPRRSYASAIDEDGNFVIDDVEPGSYAVTAFVYELPGGENRGWNMLGTANGLISVPEQGDGPVEAGEFKLQLQQRPVGQWSATKADAVVLPAPGQ